MNDFCFRTYKTTKNKKVNRNGNRIFKFGKNLYIEKLFGNIYF